MQPSPKESTRLKLRARYTKACARYNAFKDTRTPNEVRRAKRAWKSMLTALTLWQDVAA
jgi:hypothetical protein